jgi:hypothetical protein
LKAEKVKDLKNPGHSGKTKPPPEVAQYLCQEQSPKGTLVIRQAARNRMYLFINQFKLGSRLVLNPIRYLSDAFGFISYEFRNVLGNCQNIPLEVAFLLFNIQENA